MERGVKRHNARLDDEKVRYIRRSIVTTTATKLAGELGVNISTVIAAAKGATWKHVGNRAHELADIMRTGEVSGE
jgi:hypothetical protein